MDGSVIGGLVEEISWEGKRVRQYRGGGRGLENVLSAQVLQALDFLPRATCLRPVLEQATGASAARDHVAAEAERLRLAFLPGQISLPGGVGVQPDALLVGPSTYVLIEAKGPGRSSFNPEQLSREYTAVLQEAQGRTPLLLLILGEEPPVKVKRRFGRYAVVDALEWELRQLPDGVVGGTARREQLIVGVPGVLAWTTWQQIADVVAGVLDAYTVDDQSAQAAIRRLAQGVIDAIRWHTTTGG
ncbi:hypothetical protein [Propioniciclava sp.]|uniref:hypothetical protein n=1 Tax=Propioniciclava sp. TaxID=2038686 RepID=UPI002608327A|nr:hypothetical protein [Propioniciclava sp.]